ncbi:MAG: SPOR domain-containing protein [Steroidobacteraceae bacterium]
MDRRLKERLVGAAILVFLAVLLIPELLSGPARQGPAGAAPAADETPGNSPATVRHYTVQLDRPAGAAAVEMSSVPAAGASAPPSAAQSGAPRGPLPPSGADPAAPDARIQPLPTSRPPPPEPADTGPELKPASRSARGDPAPLPASAPAKPAATPLPSTVAPIGTKGGWSVQLGSFANRPNAEKLAQALRGKGIRVYVTSVGGKHRVRAGPFPDRTAAEHAAARLRTQGQAVSIVAP